MAKIENIEDRRLGERLTAHLAMGAAGEPEVTGDCLSDDQLADVATNYCSKEERAAALAHFSSCPRCYNAWVAVSMSLMAIESGTTQPFKWQSSIKGLAYLGSALAVAASVVVFLNIREMSTLSDMSLETGMKQPVERVQSMAPPAAAVMDKEKKQNRASEPSAPAPPEKNTAEFGRSESGVSADGTGEIATKSSSQPRPKAAAAPPAFQEMEADSKGLEGMLADDWFGNVEAICKGIENRPDSKRWNSLQEEGRTIVDQESSPVMRQRIEAILAIMTATDEKNAMTEQCGRILPLLAGEGDTR